jgi:iron-sulfur cluster repair protein YtfE (RIC family)
MNPIASLTLREAIRSRPLAIGLLEEKAGASFWSRLDAPLEEFCREAGVDFAALGHAIATLPEALERQDWQSLPLYYLIDYLTSGHRLFRMRDLPDVHRLLENLRIEFPAGNGSLDILVREFASFRREFGWHMEEEEEFLFPKILRIEVPGGIQGIDRHVLAPPNPGAGAALPGIGLGSFPAPQRPGFRCRRPRHGPRGHGRAARLRSPAQGACLPGAGATFPPGIGHGGVPVAAGLLKGFLCV